MAVNRNRVVWGDAGWLPHHFGFCPNERAWRHVMKLHQEAADDYPGHLKGCTSLYQRRDTKHRVALVTIGEGFDFSPAIVADLLVHEAMHVWRDMREAIGEKEPSSEFEAYALQNITANLFRAYEVTRGRLFLR